MSTSTTIHNDHLYTSLSSATGITRSEYELLAGILSPRTIKKKQFLLKEGVVCVSMAFINSGCFRLFSVDENGAEHVIEFGLEGSWMADLYSFINQTPATLSIEALEDAEVLLLEHDKLEMLYSRLPQLNGYFRVLFQQAYSHMQERLNKQLAAPATDRYKALIHLYPQITRRVPLLQIASFLDITPESLSRIRKHLHKSA